MAKQTVAFEPTFENIKESLAFELKNLTRVYEHAKKKLDENFAQNLEWAGEEMWIAVYKINKIMVLCKELDKITLKSATTWMQVQVNSITKDLLSPGTGSSTNPMTNLVKMWKAKADSDLRKLWLECLEGY